MDQSVVDHPVTLIIKAPNQKYTDQTINCFLDWTVGKLKSHLSDVYPSKPVSCGPALFLHRVCRNGVAVTSGQSVETFLGYSAKIKTRKSPAAKELSVQRRWLSLCFQGSWQYK